MERDKLPPHKRAIWDKIDQICKMLDNKEHKEQNDEGYNRLMYLLEKYMQDLQAKG